MNEGWEPSEMLAMLPIRVLSQATGTGHAIGHRHMMSLWGGGVAMWIILLVAIPLGNLGFKLGVVVRQVGDERVRSWSLAKAVTVMVDAPFSFWEELTWSLTL